MGGLINRVLRRILLKDIQVIVMSPFCDNFFVLDIPTEYACVIDAFRKTEIVTTIFQAHFEASGNAIPLKFLESISFKSRKGKTKTINFFKGEDENIPIKESKTKKLKKDLMSVITPIGLPKDAGRKKREVTVPPKNPLVSLTLRRRGTIGKFVVKALEDYNAQSARELSFKKGDLVNVLVDNANGMWQGELKGKRGVFPSNFVFRL